MRIGDGYSIARVKNLMAYADSLVMTRRTATVYIECRKWLGTWGWSGVSTMRWS